MKNEKHFISYSRVDASDFALRLASDLKANGFNIWLDQQDIRGGVVWDIAVQQALEEAECMIIILSRSSVNSPNVLDEVSFALKSNKKVYPVLKDDCKIPFRLDRIQYIDFRNSYNEGIGKLISTLDASVRAVIAPARPAWKIMLPLILVVVAILVILAFIFNTKNTTTAEKRDQPPKEDTTKTVEQPVDPGADKPTATNDVLFSIAGYKAGYELNNEVLVIHITSPNSFPSIDVDVNENKIVDPNLDRSYGIVGGSLNKICTQFLLSENSSTGCGVAPSNATLSVIDDIFTFSLPIAEIKGNPNSRSVSLQISIYNNQNGWQHFPDSNRFKDLSKVYTIPVNQ